MKYSWSDRKTVLDIPEAKGLLLAKTGKNEIVRLRLAPGGKIPQHALPVHVTFFVISGEGEIINNNEVFNPKTNDVVEVNPDTERSWKNTSTIDLELLVIKQLP